MNFWSNLIQSAGPTLGPRDLLVIFLSLFGIVGGIALIVLPKEFAKNRAQRTGADLKEVGRRERELRADFRVKVGAGIAAWFGAIILSLLLHLVGTPGLETYFLSALVLFSLPLLVGYLLVYRLFLYPRYLRASQQVDNQQSYVPATKKSKKALEKSPLEQKISLMPGKAMIGLALTAIGYYIVMTGFSIPPGPPIPNHDHLLHQAGMLVMALVGYVAGLAISIGDPGRTIVRYTQPIRK